VHQEQAYNQLVGLKKLQVNLEGRGADSLTPEPAKVTEEVAEGAVGAGEGLQGVVGGGGDIAEAILKLGQAPVDEEGNLTEGVGVFEWRGADDIQDLLGGSIESLGAAGSAVKSIVDLVAGWKRWKEKEGTEAIDKFTDSLAGIGTGVAKGASGVLGIVKGAAKSKAAKDVLDVFKNLLGPIPPLIEGVANIVKTISAIVQKKTADAFENGWNALKAGFEFMVESAKTVMSFIKEVPLIGAIASFISNLVSLFEAGYMFVKRAWQAAQEAKREKKLRTRTSTSRVKVLLSITGKRLKNRLLGVARYGTAIWGSVTKLLGSAGTLASEGVALAGITAPAAMIGRTVGKVVEVLGSVISSAGKAIEAVPKVLHWFRQRGRDVAGGSSFLAGAAKKVYDPSKSTQKKHEERKEFVTGLLNDAANLQTQFQPGGKSKDAVLAEIKAMLDGYRDLELDIKATGVNMKKLYKLNKDDESTRAQKQAKLLYEALKER
jgi:hypothetical protein